MVNLAPAQRAVEGLMADRGALRRNPGGVDDDVLNPNPGNLELDPGGIEPYYTGRMGIRLSRSAANGETDSTASFPLEVTPQKGDLLEVLESRDPGVVGRWFRLDDVRGGTFAVSRRVVLAEVAPPPAEA